MSEEKKAHKAIDSEEYLWAEYTRTKDVEIRNKLFMKYKYIAEILAKKFINRGVEYDDLFQIASIALIKALERFDISKGYKFSSFATPTIVGEIKNYFRDKSKTIRLPRKESEYIKKIDNATNYLSNTLGRFPKAEEIAEYLNISTEEVLEIMESSYSTNTASLDFYIDNEDETDLLSIIGQEEESYQAIEDKDLVERIMYTLDETEREVIYQRFYKSKSQKEVSEQLGVSQMYISRMERKLIDRFRRYLKHDI